MAPAEIVVRCCGVRGYPAMLCALEMFVHVTVSVYVCRAYATLFFICTVWRVYCMTRIWFNFVSTAKATEKQRIVGVRT